MIKEIAYILLW